MNKNFYIGLDIGTDSIGWAVTDTDYNLIKKRGRDFWGTYLFTKAETAEKRRGYRTARRRTARTRQRLNLLQSLFADEICKIDPAFFLRLKNSSLYLEDKSDAINCKDILFADKDFSDKHYYWQFPTIYHLRNYLLTNKPQDVRFLYIALHHIIKNRGHFLFEGQNFDVNDTDNIVQKFETINSFLDDKELATFYTQNIAQAISVINDKNFTKTDKIKKLKTIFQVAKEKHLEGAIRAMVGAKTSLSLLYPDYDGDHIEISFERDDFDENILPQINSLQYFVNCVGLSTTKTLTISFCSENGLSKSM